MRNLLSAGFTRLWHNKLFYVVNAAILLLAAGIMLNFGRQALADTSGYTYYLEQHYFDTSVYMGIFSSAFFALFIGTEFSEGTIRNKLTVGHTRIHVYLSNLTICAAASLVFTAAWMVGGMAGIPALGPWSIGASGVLLSLVISVLSSVALSALFLLVSMLSTNKSMAAVACIFLSLALIVTASYFYNHLCEPEMSSGMMITIEGGLQLMDPTPNPNYVAEPLRSVFAAIVNILPTGQMILLANIKSPEGLAIYPLQIAGSLLLTVLSTVAGLILFKHKDLK